MITTLVGGDTFKGYVPGRGQIVVTKPIQSLDYQGTFHFNDGYYYFRTIGKRILFGGGRNEDIEGENTG
jgi:glycine/D-amino acid oxidase-like deaminating enzyme